VLAGGLFCSVKTSIFCFANKNLLYYILYVILSKNERRRQDMERTKTGKAKGGKAVNAKRTPEERKALSEKMVAAKAKLKNLPKVIYSGDLELGDISIPCAVLDNGMRVLSEFGLTNAILGGRSGASKRQKSEGALMPLFLAPKRLEPFIINAFPRGAPAALECNNNGKVMNSFEASILPKACEVWLAAREANVLQQQQELRAQKAEIMMRALAHIGIIALVDEATGYQQERAKNALAEILEKFVAKEIQPYIKTFPPEFYENLFRLWELPYPPMGNSSFRPAFFGKITNDVVYKRLAPGILPELKKMAQQKKSKLHRGLTRDIGHPKLREHLASIVTLQKLARNKQEWMELVDKIHPKYKELPLLESLEP
jgi:hypothetical protein